MTGEAPLFEALIAPHQSLGPRGLRWAAVVIAGFLLLVGLRCWMIGAWPVLPFGAAEAIFIAVMFRLSARSATATEYLVLTGGELRVVRTSATGRVTERILPSAWLAVSLRERHGRVPILSLRSRGRHFEIARVLGEAAKRDLASRLADALHRARNPRFDNAQLRD